MFDLRLCIIYMYINLQNLFHVQQSSMSYCKHITFGGALYLVPLVAVSLRQIKYIFESNNNWIKIKRQIKFTS